MVPVAERRVRDEFALIITAAAAVDHQHCRARPARGEFDFPVW